MEILIRLTIDENRVDNIELLLDETASKVDDMFNIGGKHSACKSATITSDSIDIEIGINNLV